MGSFQRQQPTRTTRRAAKESAAPGPEAGLAEMVFGPTETRPTAEAEPSEGLLETPSCSQKVKGKHSRGSGCHCVELAAQEQRMREKMARSRYFDAVEKASKSQRSVAGSPPRVAAPPPNEKKQVGRCKTSDLHGLGCECLAAMKPQNKKHIRKGNCKKAPLTTRSR